MILDFDSYIINESSLKKLKKNLHGVLNMSARKRMRKELRDNIITFKFKKRNGEIRTAHGTLHPDYLPKLKGGAPRPEHQMVYYDLDKEGWRSFRSYSFIKILNIKPVDSKTIVPKPKPVAKEDATANEAIEIEFDEAKLTKLLGSAPVEADSTQTTENVVSYEYDTNDIIDEAKQNAQALIEGLMNGSIGIFKEGYQVSLDQVGVENLEVVDNTTNWSETSFIQTLDYSARDKARQEAQSWFDSQTAILSREEKVIEIKKKSADTEYQAATTEYESVKQLISDNSERSFSIWS